MNKMDKHIMVIAREKLFPQGAFHGFLPHSQENIYDKITAHHEYRRRGDMEADPSFQQPIPYCVIMSTDRQILAYNRQQQTEQRLVGKWSIGIGCHIDDDHKSDSDALHISMLRELEEEAGLKDLKDEQIQLLGYIKDDTDEVGQVHLGLLYLITVDSKDLECGDDAAGGKLISVDELKDIFAKENVETWSQIAFEAIKNHL